MGFDTKNLKPWVVLGAQEIIGKFGVRTAYGWRKTDPFPDHPSGLAVDFMISDMPNGKATGDAIANYVIANGARLGVKYLIWYRRSYNIARGTWQPYTSSPNPHTDHVHVTWNSSAPSGATTIPVSDTTSVANPFSSQLKQLNDIANWLNDRGNWKRYGFMSAGVVCILLGIFKFSSVANPVITKTGEAVKGVINNVGK